MGTNEDTNGKMHSFTEWLKERPITTSIARKDENAFIEESHRLVTDYISSSANGVADKLLGYVATINNQLKQRSATYKGINSSVVEYVMAAKFEDSFGINANAKGIDESGKWDAKLLMKGKGGNVTSIENSPGSEFEDIFIKNKPVQTPEYIKAEDIEKFGIHIKNIHEIYINEISKFSSKETSLTV